MAENIQEKKVKKSKVFPQFKSDDGCCLPCFSNSLCPQKKMEVALC